jgi:hypothetical protein
LYSSLFHCLHLLIDHGKSGWIKQDQLVNRRPNFQNEVNDSFKIVYDVSALKN